MCEFPTVFNPIVFGYLRSTVEGNGNLGGKSLVGLRLRSTHVIIGHWKNLYGVSFPGVNLNLSEFVELSLRKRIQNYNHTLINVPSRSIPFE